MIVYVCSPYQGKEENYKKAVSYCKAAAAAGHVPIASHVMLHGILDESKDREKGLTAGLKMIELADEVWVCGETISSGMAAEIERAKAIGKPVVFKGAIL
jgi:hypothetical protein